MPTDQELLAIKERAAAQLMARPSIVGVGIGGRIRDGEPTGEVVLKVYVKQKLPRSDVGAAELVPTEFEGVPTDVVELPGELELHQAPPGKPALPGVKRDTRRKRPVIGGTQVQVDLAGSGFGTAGCMLVDPADAAKVYALTNWHVLATPTANPTVGTTKAGQPTNDDSSTKCCSAIIGKVAGGGVDASRDTGLVRLDPGTEWKADILEIGAVAGPHTITPAEAAPQTYPVRKRGMYSGLTGGTVQAIGANLTLGGQAITNVIVISPNPDPGQPAGTEVFFSQRGDSGAALVNDANEIVGLVFGGSIPGQPGHPPVISVAYPLDAVLSGLAAQDHLTVQLATATTPGVVHTVPGAAMSTLPPEIAPALVGESATSPARAPVRVPVAGTFVAAPPAVALARLERDLDRSERGRALLCLWLQHEGELLRLVNTNRRVATVWHRSGGAALFQLLVRMVSQSELALPTALHGQPLTACLDRLYAAFHRFASPELRLDLARARTGLPELGGLTYDGICSALAAD